jgi:hypothetical protein
MEETLNRLKTESPQKSQTGPAIRYDQKTIEQHLRLLEQHPSLKKIYQLLTTSIQASAQGLE